MADLSHRCLDVARVDKGIVIGKASDCLNSAARQGTRSIPQHGVKARPKQTSSFALSMSAFEA
jgi:hypothetical protein